MILSSQFRFGASMRDWSYYISAVVVGGKRMGRGLRYQESVYGTINRHLRAYRDDGAVPSPSSGHGFPDSGWTAEPRCIFTISTA